MLEWIAELVFLGFSELLTWGYMKLMTLIVPDKQVSSRVRDIIRFVTKIIAGILAFILLIGLMLSISYDPTYYKIGQYMVNISLGIIIAQIVLGISFKIFTRIKK